MGDGQKHSRRTFLLDLAGAAQAPASFHAYAEPDLRYGALTYDQSVLTPNADFFSVRLGAIPQVDRDRWTLTFDGLVERPLTLDWPAVAALPAVEDVRAVVSIANPVGGPLIGNARWRGVALKPLLAHIGPRPEATHARFDAADGYSVSVDLRRLRDGALLAYEMNGDALPPAQGYPVRALIPGLYEHKMPKWLTRVTFTDRAHPGYWERHGWSETAMVKTHAMFRSPPTRAAVTGYVYLQGIAFAGDRAIQRVEVSIDEGAWLEAELLRPASPLAWTQWFFRWQPDAPGSHSFRVRATDASGFTQSEASGRPFPDGTDAIHQITLTVKP